MQERRNLQSELESHGLGRSTMTAIEEAFVQVAKSYGERQGISYARGARSAFRRRC